MLDLESAQLPRPVGFVVPSLLGLVVALRSVGDRGEDLDPPLSPPHLTSQALPRAVAGDLRRVRPLRRDSVESEVKPCLRSEEDIPEAVPVESGGHLEHRAPGTGPSAHAHCEGCASVGHFGPARGTAELDSITRARTAGPLVQLCQAIPGS